MHQPQCFWRLWLWRQSYVYLFVTSGPFPSKSLDPKCKGARVPKLSRLCVNGFASTFCTIWCQCQSHVEESQHVVEKILMLLKRTLCLTQAPTAFDSIAREGFQSLMSHTWEWDRNKFAGSRMPVCAFICALARILGVNTTSYWVCWRTGMFEVHHLYICMRKWVIRLNANMFVVACCKCKHAACKCLVQPCSFRSSLASFLVQVNRLDWEISVSLSQGLSQGSSSLCCFWLFVLIF